MFFGYFFTSVRVTLELLAINVEKPLQWRLQTRLVFFVSKTTFNSINKFLENRNQNSLDTTSVPAVFR